jgi:hypothetical protein
MWSVPTRPIIAAGGNLATLLHGTGRDDCLLLADSLSSRLIRDSNPATGQPMAERGYGMKARLALAAAGLALLLAGCENTDVLDGNAARPYPLEDPAAVVAKANWDDVQEVMVILGADYAIDPAYISVELGRPYKLVVRNYNWTDQSLVADEFFKTIAIKEVSSGDFTYELPNLDEMVIPSGEEREMYFVPTLRGIYNVTGRFPVYTSLGFVGRIEVE